jgi:hypothetical protein
MKIELDKEALVKLINGSTPSYEQMEFESIKKGGYYVGGHVDRWQWDVSRLRAMEDTELFNIYTLLNKNHE